VPVREYRILTPEEFDRLHATLGSPAAQLLIETAAVRHQRRAVHRQALPQGSALAAVPTSPETGCRAGGVRRSTRQGARRPAVHLRRHRLSPGRVTHGARLCRRPRTHSRPSAAAGTGTGPSPHTPPGAAGACTAAPGSPSTGRGVGPRGTRAARRADQADRRAPPPRLVPPSAVAAGLPGCRYRPTDPAARPATLARVVATRRRRRPAGRPCHSPRPGCSSR
jgi:hypothetical protein